MKRHAAAPTGFTLLEVLVALGIFVASVAILSRLVVLGLENAEYARLQTHGWMLAENVMAQFDAGIVTLDDVGAPVEDEDFPGWQWTLVTEPGAVTGINQVTVLVEHGLDGTQRKFSLQLTRLFLDESAFETETETE